MNKKKYLSLIYIFLNILIITVIGLADPELKGAGQIFKEIRLIWILLALLWMVIYWILDGLIIKYATGIIFEPRSFASCLKVTLIGQYYNAVTPFSSGGQPSQVYYMSKIGVPTGVSSSIFIIKYLVHQVVISIFYTLAMVFKGPYILRNNGWVFWFALLGFITNAGAAFVLMTLSWKRSVIEKIGQAIIKLLSKIRLIKDLDKANRRLDNFTDQYYEGVSLMKNNKKILFNMGVITALQMAFFFSITVFIYLALGNNSADSWISLVFIQALLYMAVAFVPTPGSTGASETGFIGFFKLFFPSNLIFIAMLFWRIITYYLNILVGVILLIWDSLKVISKKAVQKGSA